MRADVGMHVRPRRVLTGPHSQMLRSSAELCLCPIIALFSLMLLAATIVVISQHPWGPLLLLLHSQAATGLPSGSAVTPGGWQVLHTPDGRAYYYHAATSTTQWDAPAGL